MKIVIAGGSGQIGTVLAETYRRRGDEVVVLSRRDATRGARLWDGRTAGAWTEELEGADVVINLAGRSVDCRYGRTNREEILRSRVESTRVIGEAIARAARPPKLWLNASTATIYAHRYDAPNDEHTGIIGGGVEPGAPRSWHFSTVVAKAWEQAVDEAVTPQTRKVKLRTAIVMTPARGGAFHALLRHGRLGFGRFGHGGQFVSWIHECDFIRAIDFLIEHEELDGAVNLAAPNPLPNDPFMRILREAWGTRFAVPTLAPMVHIGAFLMRTEPELVMKSRRVVPARLLEHGFEFQFPEWREAARELVSRYRNGGGAACAWEPSPQF